MVLRNKLRSEFCNFCIFNVFVITIATGMNLSKYDLDVEIFGVHLAQTQFPTSVHVRWFTEQPQSNKSDDLFPVRLVFGQESKKLTRNATGLFSRLLKNYPDSKSLHLHHAIFTNLASETTYYYEIYAGNNSRQFHFRSPTTWATNSTVSIPTTEVLVIGDILPDSDIQGSMICLEKLLESYPNVSAILHVGLSPQNSDFYRRIEGFASRIPLMNAKGIRENEDSIGEGLFHCYSTVPPFKEEKDLKLAEYYYNFNQGLTNFFSMDSWALIHNSESDTTKIHLKNLQKWFQLKNTKFHTRSTRPWIVGYGTLPLYCSTNPSTIQVRHRTYPKCIDDYVEARASLEKTFYDGGLNLYFGGHENYERTFPMHRGKATEKDFTHPHATVYVNVGPLGRSPTYWKSNMSRPIPKSYSAATSLTSGFGLLKIINKTTLQWKFYSTEPLQNSEYQCHVIDSMILHTLYHVPFQPPDRHSPSMLSIIAGVFLLFLVVLFLIFIRKRIRTACRAKSWKPLFDGTSYTYLHQAPRVIEDEDTL